jgi:amino acid adenylation domain-containing protein
MSASLIERILANGKRVPNSVALSGPTSTVRYDELARRVGGVARTMRAAGIGPECRVAICLERGQDLILGILGALACGATYVPLDPDVPQARLEQILHHCRPTAIVAGEDAARLAESVGVARLDPGGWSTDGPVSDEGAGELAYIVYTSGSSGAPKGVMVEHASLENYLDWCVAELPFTGHGVPLFASVSFDHAITCYLPPLLKGETVVLLPSIEGGRSLARALLTGRRYSYVKITPSHLRLLDLDQRAELGRLTNLVMFGGEHLTGNLVADVRRDEPELAVMNHYGPTEATIGCCVYRVPSGATVGAVPIGKPIPGVTATVRRADHTAAAINEPGELHVGGRGVARGYWDEPELTARSFVAVPDGTGQPERWYLTGDLVVRCQDGQLSYLGRADDQVKILGHRVEPAEIEHVLGRHPQVGEAFVVADQSTERTRLVGAVTLAFGTITEQQLRSHLRTHLPAALVPARVVVLQRPPITRNGKVDRQEILAAAAPTEHDEALSTLEDKIAAGFAELLGLLDPDPDEDFFELGGDSLASVETLAWIREELGVDLAVSALFDHPTARSLAHYIQEQQR